MVPKTKNQKRVEELSSTLLNIYKNKKRIKWMNKTCFTHYGFRMKKGTTCMECGHEFTTTGETSVCPKCKTELTILDTRKRSEQMFSYACFIETSQEWQVVRYFELSCSLLRERPADYSICEVMQFWINPKGEKVVKSRLRAGMFSSKYSWWSKLEIRKPQINHELMCTDNEYPDMQIIPELIRNGFNGIIGRHSPQTVFSALLCCPELETLKKIGYDNYFDYFITKDHSYIKEYWPSIKICLRNKYPLNKVAPSTFIDHIHLLKRFNKDIHSPKYICPQNFEEEHLRYIRKRDEIYRREDRKRHQERILQERTEMLARSEKYKKEKKKFSNLCISNEKIVIKPLLTIEDFEQESNIMMHCLFQKNYLEKDRLILSAEINGVKVETIEVNLTNFTISQCRGRHNKKTHYHSKIIRLVKQNMGLIQHPPKAKKVKFKPAKAA